MDFLRKIVDDLGLFLAGDCRVLPTLSPSAVQIPRSKLAAVSSLYHFYYDVVAGGEMLSNLAELHKVYGKYFVCVASSGSLMIIPE